MTVLFFSLAAAGFLTGGAMVLVRRSQGSEHPRRGYLLAVVVAALAALFLWSAWQRIQHLST